MTQLKPGTLFKNLTADHSYAIVQSVVPQGLVFFLFMFWSPDGWIIEKNYPIAKNKMESGSPPVPAEDRHKHVLVRMLFRYGIDRINK
jgi:hypothetical protein